MVCMLIAHRFFLAVMAFLSGLFPLLRQLAAWSLLTWVIRLDISGLSQCVKMIQTIQWKVLIQLQAWTISITCAFLILYVYKIYLQSPKLIRFHSGPNTDLLGRRWFLVLGNLVIRSLQPNTWRV